MSACERVNNIEALLAAQQPVPESETRWMIDQMRGWQQWAKGVVDYGDIVGKLRTATFSSQPISLEILDGYEQLFKVK